MSDGGKPKRVSAFMVAQQEAQSAVQPAAQPEPAQPAVQPEPEPEPYQPEPYQPVPDLDDLDLEDDDTDTVESPPPLARRGETMAQRKARPRSQRSIYASQDVLEKVDELHLELALEVRRSHKCELEKASVLDALIKTGLKHLDEVRARIRREKKLK